jgi:hypothetical protein
MVLFALVSLQPLAASVRVLGEVYNADTTHLLSLFNFNVSSLPDRVGDVPGQYGYIDVVYAQVRQINLDTLQFEMKVRSAIPLDPGNGTVAYLWMIDTDLDPNTGQRHFFVGSEYNVRLAFYDGHWQGWVDPISERPGGGQCPVFVDNDTVSILVRRSQIGNAARALTRPALQQPSDYWRASIRFT